MNMIDRKLEEKFRSFIDENFSEGPEKDFVIQYSMFEKMDSITWYFNYVEPYKTNDEGLYNIDVNYSDSDVTNVEFSSWKCDILISH